MFRKCDLTGKLMIVPGPQYFKAARSYALAAASSSSYAPVESFLRNEKPNDIEEAITVSRNVHNCLLTQVNCRNRMFANQITISMECENSWKMSDSTVNMPCQNKYMHGHIQRAGPCFPFLF